MELPNKILSMHNTARQARSKTRSALVLRNLTHLDLVLDNPTSWISKEKVLRRFIEVYYVLYESGAHKDADVTTDTSAEILVKVNMYYSFPTEINTVAKSLSLMKASS